MPRQTISLEGLRAFLIDGMTDAIHRDARFVAPDLVIRRRDGKPNWDASIGIQPPALLKGFADVLLRMQAQYDLE